MQNNTITLKGVTETHIILAVNGKEHEILLNSDAFEQFLQSYNQTTFQSGSTIYNIEEIKTATFVFQIKSIAPKPKHLNHIPLALPPKVIGRKNDLEKVEELLFKDNALVIVNGIGGIGKTVLSHYYWQERQYKYTHLLWLKGEGNLQDSLIYDYNLHAGLGIVEEMKYHLEAIRQPNNAQAKEQAFACVAAALKNVTPKGLMLIDNATDKNHWTIKQWKTTFDNFHILGTSRNIFDDICTYSLGYLCEKEAIELFYLYYDREENNALVTEIVKIAGYHTLTIELLAKNTKHHRGLNLEQLLLELQQNIVYQPKKVEITTNYTKEQTHINTILEYCFDISEIIKDEKTIYYLSQFSVLPTQYLPDNELKQIFSITDRNENDYYQAIDTLVKKGWLQDDNSSYFCHQIIAEIVRKKVSYSSINFSDYVEFYLNKSNFAYALIVANNILEARINENTKDYKEISVANNNVSIVYRKMSDFQKSLEYRIYALDIWENNVYEFNWEYANLCNGASSSFMDATDYLNAFKYAQKGIEIRLKLYGENSAQVAGSYCQIAVILKKQEQEQIDDSLMYNQKGIKTQREINDIDGLVISLNNLGDTYKSISDYQSALDSLHEAEKLLPISIHKEKKDMYAKTYMLISECYCNIPNPDYIKSISYIKKSIIEWLEIPHIIAAKSSISVMENILDKAIKSGGRSKYQTELDWFVQNCSQYLQ